MIKKIKTENTLIILKMEDIIQIYKNKNGKYVNKWRTVYETAENHGGGSAVI